jgi:arginine repressor
MTRTQQTPSRAVVGTFTGVGLAIGIAVAVLASDVILGVIAGAAFIAIAVGMVRLWTGGGPPSPRRP